jgi:hypothetical protein
MQGGKKWTRNRKGKQNGKGKGRRRGWETEKGTVLLNSMRQTRTQRGN